jgi:hypothetical protein
MAAVMVREAFGDDWSDDASRAAPARRVRSAARPVPVRAVPATATQERAGDRVVDLRGRRPRSVFDDEPEAVLRLVVPTAAAASPPVAVEPQPHRDDHGRVPGSVERRGHSRRRAWLVVAAVALAIVGVAVTDDPAGGRLGGHDDAATAAVPSAAAPTVSIVVQPGDTLWSIAASLVGTDDPRPLVDELLVAHGSAELHPGDVITIPAP